MGVRRIFDLHCNLKPPKCYQYDQQQIYCTRSWVFQGQYPCLFQRIKQVFNYTKHNNTELKMKNTYIFCFHFLWSTKSIGMSFYHKNHRDMHNSDQHLRVQRCVYFFVYKSVTTMKSKITKPKFQVDVFKSNEIISLSLISQKN